MKFYLIHRLKKNQNKPCYVSGEAYTKFYSKGLESLFNIVT